MKFSNFELEDLYNSHEDSVKSSISSACLDPLSIDKLYDLVFKYNNDRSIPGLIPKEKFFETIFNLELDYSSRFGLKSFEDALKNKYGQNLNFLSTTGA